MSERYQVRLRKSKGPLGRLFQLVRLGLFSVVAIALVGAAAAGVLFLYYLRGLPSVEKLSEYRPYVISRVYDRNGTLIGEIKKENIRRIVVSIDDIQEHVVQAFVSAEDKNFFRHQGLDYMGIFRAFLKNLIAGQIVEGGSTITQQVVKSIFLSPERSIERKIKEAIIAQRIERKIPKRRILELYLNQIYFGHGAYGIEVAAQTFFGKHASELTVSEAALLAGLPKAPQKYSPYRHPEAAEKRRRYVLYRMREDGHLTGVQLAEALSDRPVLRPLSESVHEIKAPYFFDVVVRQLFELFGEDVVYRAGWDIYTTLDLKLQEQAKRALQNGLREYSKRHGFTGAVEHIPQSGWRDYVAKLKGVNRNLEDRYGIMKALVVATSDRKRSVAVDAGVEQGVIPYRYLKWAFSVRNRDGEVRRLPHVPSRILKPGDVVWVRRAGGRGAKAVFSLEQMPQVQGAVVVMDPHTREVLALCGGYDYYDSPFNRAVQAQRQPGSAFKPIVYSAALNAGFTPAHMFVDTALIFDDGWRPRNYGTRFHGRVSLRKAIALSLNTVTVRLMLELGADYVREYARNLGIELPQVEDYSFALGSYGVRPIELANAYAVFASGGLYAKPYIIKEIRDSSGHVIVRTGLSEEAVVDIVSADAFKPSGGVTQSTSGPKPAAHDTYAFKPKPTNIAEIFGFDIIKKRRVMSPQIAYLTTSLLESVVREGTGMRALALGRPCAGKTGTTNDSRDAWFIGYTPDLLCGVWVGFDDARPLGSRETGAKAALPIWLEFMKAATWGEPVKSFVVPPGIVFARIDPETGLLAPHDDPDAYSECFLEGTVPQEFAAEATTAPYGLPEGRPPAPEDLSEL